MGGYNSRMEKNKHSGVLKFKLLRKYFRMIA
jgi:hypothetical protein